MMVKSQMDAALDTIVELSEETNERMRALRDVQYLLGIGFDAASNGDSAVAKEYIDRALLRISKAVKTN